MAISTQKTSSSSPGTKQRKRKRLQTSTVERLEGEEGPSQRKFHSLSGVWRNLDLVLSLQSKDIDPTSKIKLAYDFVSSKAVIADEDESRCQEPLQISHLASFLGGWIQSLLISKIWDFSDHCLDSKCWLILKFSLEKSSFKVSANVLEPVTRVLDHALSQWDGGNFGDEFAGLYETVLDCLPLLFAAHGRTINNARVDLWVSFSLAAVHLNNRIFSNKSSDFLCAADVLAQLSSLIFEQFASFLRFHPSPKQIFLSFVKKLLEPLLESLVLLRQDTLDGDCELKRKLLSSVEDVLSNGLFHPVHMSWFLSLKSSDLKVEGNESMRSYQRHLFQEVKRIVTEKKRLAMTGLGELFHLFVGKVKKKNEDHMAAKSSQPLEKGAGVEVQETSQPVFEVFILFLDPLLVEYKKKFKEMDFQKVGDVCEPVLVEVQSILKSTNEILGTFMHEKIYMPMKDSTEGANYSFLKDTFDTILSIYRKVYQLWLLARKVLEPRSRNVVASIVEELVISLGYFLEIEYKIVGNDLVLVWLMMLSCLVVYTSLKNEERCRLMTPKILHLAFQVIKLYSELRQVSISIFALSKAVRIFFSGNNDEADYSLFLPSRSLTSKVCSEAAGALLLSKELRVATSRALEFIPEGQAGDCIEQLKLDVAECLKWIRTDTATVDEENSSKKSIPNSGKLICKLQAEGLGLLSELYTIVLDSLTVVTSNSSSIGKSTEDFISTLSPSFSSLAENQYKNVHEFLYSVTGRRFSNHGAHETVVLKDRLYTSWILVFFFRIYISCRSLYRQAISLMPHNARKSAAAMGSLFTVYCGEKWIEKTNWTEGSYFSWVVVPSHSLVTVIQMVLECFFPNRTNAHAPLVYVLQTMALQRLIDLNRLIKSFEFLQKRESQLAHSQTLDAAVDLLDIKKDEWKLLIEVSRQEAADLTSFMTGFLPSIPSRGKQISGCSEMSANNCVWDFTVCSLNEKSLPTATWWLLCQNVDIWCAHASNEIMQNFLSLLIHHALPNMQSSLKDARKEKEVYSESEVNVHQISSELLMDTVFHEQRNLSRQFTSMLLHSLKESFSSLILYAGTCNINLSNLPDWSEAETILEKLLLVGKDVRQAPYDGSEDRAPSPLCHLQDHSARESFDMELQVCHSLLNLLCRVIKVHINAKSISLFATSILNLERLLVLTLLKCYEESLLLNHFELFRLFLSCRRALRYLAVASFEDSSTEKHSPLIQVLYGNASCISWLLKSVSVMTALPYPLFNMEYYDQKKEMFFSLIDHTSYLFFMLTKGPLIAALPSLVNGQMPQAELPVYDGLSSQDKLVEVDLETDSSENVDTWKEFELVAENLKEQTDNLLIIYRGLMPDSNTEFIGNAMDWNRLSSIISCFQGFMWGLTSALGTGDEKNPTGCTSKLKHSFVSKLYSYINVFEGFVNFCLSVLLVDSQSTEFIHNLNNPLEFGREYNSLNTEVPFDGAHRSCSDKAEIASGDQPERAQGRQTDESTSYMDGGCENSPATNCTNYSCTKKGKILAASANGRINVLTIVHSLDLSKFGNLKETLMQRLLKGECPEVAFLVRQLFISSAAILKLKYILTLPRALRSQIDCRHTSSSSTSILLQASYCLLLEMADMTGTPDSFSYICLDGTLKYLEVVGQYISCTDSVLSRNVYSQLINVHLRAIGKCISLQGKSATLASHEMGSNTKMLYSEKGSSENDVQSLDHRAYNLNEFKARLSASFREFIGRPLELHLLSAVQSLERALVGIRQDCNMIYDISTGNLDGGKVSSFVAAGVYCFDLVLECVSASKSSSMKGQNSGHVITGKNHLNVIKRHIKSLVRSLFNIVLHLHNPSIFYQMKLPDGISNIDPEPGSVILMCVEVLTKVAGNQALLQLDPCLVEQCLHLPMILFRDFHQLKLINEKHSAILDRQFSVDLYAACCRLLCTTLRHRKSEAGRCIALLEDSVNVLLVCLETVNTDLVSQKGFFAWETQEAVKCASFLHRIYEEIRQQKDLLARYSSFFLSTYIRVYSGFGPRKSGIKREIEEALRPGVYALFDICSPSDLQQLHAVLGEGPCRRTLATLQHDYRLNFQYEGKI